MSEYIILIMKENMLRFINIDVNYKILHMNAITNMITIINNYFPLAKQH